MQAQISNRTRGTDARYGLGLATEGCVASTPVDGHPLPFLKDERMCSPARRCADLYMGIGRRRWVTPDLERWRGGRHGRALMHAVRSPVGPAMRGMRRVSMASGQAHHRQNGGEPPHPPRRARGSPEGVESLGSGSYGPTSGSSAGRNPPHSRAQ
jgi:hypothetical protein